MEREKLDPPWSTCPKAMPLGFAKEAERKLGLVCLCPGWPTLDQAEHRVPCMPRSLGRPGLTSIGSDMRRKTFLPSRAREGLRDGRRVVGPLSMATPEVINRSGIRHGGSGGIPVDVDDHRQSSWRDVIHVASATRGSRPEALRVRGVTRESRVWDGVGSDVRLLRWVGTANETRTSERPLGLLGWSFPLRAMSAGGETVVTWLILPVVICLSQRLSHACPSINKFVL
jgi:hypothetical protein